MTCEMPEPEYDPLEWWIVFLMILASAIVSAGTLYVIREFVQG